jgi:hypothetical protein
LALSDSSHDFLSKIIIASASWMAFNAFYNNDYFDLYKLMIDSSESLIQRRQKTNAFFITVIGSLLAIVGLLVKTEVINSGSFGILYGFSVVGLLFCNSCDESGD